MEFYACVRRRKPQVRSKHETFRIISSIVVDFRCVVKFGPIQKSKYQEVISFKCL